MAPSILLLPLSLAMSDNALADDLALEVKLPGATAPARMLFEDLVVGPLPGVVLDNDEGDRWLLELDVVKFEQGALYLGLDIYDVRPNWRGRQDLELSARPTVVLRPDGQEWVRAGCRQLVRGKFPRQFEDKTVEVFLALSGIGAPATGWQAPVQPVAPAAQPWGAPAAAPVAADPWGAPAAEPAPAADPWAVPAPAEPAPTDPWGSPAQPASSADDIWGTEAQ